MNYGDELWGRTRKMNYKARQKKLRDSLSSSRFDILLISYLPNIRYLCGFTGSAGFLVLTHTSSVFLTDVRYDRQAREEVQGAKVVIARKALVSAVAEWMGSRRKKTGPLTIGVEGEKLTLGEKKRLAELLPFGTRLNSAPEWVERLRMVKEEDELASIRAAVQLGARLFARAVEGIPPGEKETEVAAEMEYVARQAGAEAMSFPTIIASGERSALPHGRATRAKLPKRGFVTLDFGVVLDGYCSDMTRTVHLGRATTEERDAYEA